MRKRSWGSLAAVLALGGCGSITQISSVDYYPLYHPGLVQNLAASGSVATVIHGQPVPGGRAGSDETVASVLRLPGYYAQARFEPVAPLPASGPRIVFRFDSEPVGAQALCSGIPSGDGAAARGPLDVEAAFCFSERPVAQARLRTARPRAADEPRFAQAMNQLLSAMLPPQDPNLGDGCVGDC